ncbi:NUDIX domain-containing protein [Vibrio sp. SCSIO 43132]|uniref:NUDIX hydrolase n=1 Tax=Vibrio sp. SCSIO 43132 TaxID=2779363 RepID=UPI001CA8EAFE|nr:NUDIX domain-containing protein [Vibrio sp. SCSIO 43132]UAB73950.1 NUDIX domain-containing protein [Vibrio sp. SCSIO 43132]
MNINKTLIENRKAKACPLVLRQGSKGFEILVFRHPLAGVQLVKGTIEPTDASIEQAALRELAEESGIEDVSRVSYLNEWSSGYEGQVWYFVLCDCNALPEQWTFYTQDDGGHEFEFYWHSLSDSLSSQSHPVFERAICHVREALAVNK